jgi:DNA segregation ATPase FtsK/SpoIIIE-like protein
MTWGKDPDGLWKKGDEPGGMELGPVNWREIGLAAVVAAVLGIVLWLDARANDAPQWRPERAAWPGWHVLGIVLVTLLCLLATVGVIWLFHTALVSMLRRSHEYRVQRERDATETERQKAQNGTTHLAELLAAAHISAEGALVRMTDKGWQVVNLGSEKGAVLMGDDGTVQRTLHDKLSVAQIAARFEVEREEARSRAFPALHTLQQRNDASAASAEAVKQQAAAWPRVVRLHEIASDPATVQRLALGVTVDESGRPMPVTAALGEMVHVAVGGSSGWGKSIFLKALGLQLATAAEPIELAMVDLEGVTFAAFSRADRLLWPIAETTGQALRIMAYVLEEMERRRALFHEFPGVDSLSAYNARAGDEQLAPLVVLVDEATALLADRSVHNRTKELVLRARKFGIWFVLGGQDWKASSLDTALRNMLATRVQFHTSSGSQSRMLLGDGAAAGLVVAGRAIVQLPGRPQLEIQAPLVTTAEISAALRGQEGPAFDLPEEDEEVESDDPEAERILELHRKGWTSRAIEREIFGKTGGAYYERVRRVLESAATATRDNGDSYD